MQLAAGADADADADAPRRVAARSAFFCSLRRSSSTLRFFACSVKSHTFNEVLEQMGVARIFCFSQEPLGAQFYPSYMLEETVL